MNLVDVHLHGPLADRYGALHRLEIGTPHEAIRAIDANFPGFVRDFAQTQVYYVLADGDWREGDEAASLPVSRELHLVPQVEGRALLAGALIGALFPSLATTTILGISAASLIGGALFLGVMVGLSFLFRPKTPKAGQEERNESFAFTGPENVVTQGAPVPLVYGRLHCGSVVVSAGTEVAELEEWVAEKDNMNELRSKQFAKIVDVVSDGPIVGIVQKDIFLDGVALKNDDGSNNFKNTKVQVVTGTRNQAIMSGFQAQTTPIAVSTELDYGTPLVRAITNLDTDRVRVTLSVPQLQRIDSEGEVHGSTVPFKIEVQNNGGGYVTKVTHEITGKTSSLYQRNYLITLPKPGPWDLRVSRTEKKDTRVRVSHDLYWDSYDELIDDRVNYNGTAAVGLQLDSEQFQSIPKRTYLTTGLIIKVPSNYDPDVGTYDGVWDGTFKNDHTSNPAWILYDLLTNHRHGIGGFLSASQVDKWALYRISQWCDQRVGNGHGGTERRFTCNVQITEQQEAFDLIAEIAGVFRGFTYWSGTQMVAVADQPDSAVYQFSNANVIDGIFTYSGSDLRGRHTTVTVGWNDPKQMGQPRLSIVEDDEAIARYGIQEAEIQAIGCTSEAQAIRTGRWALYTELYEGEAVTFSTGLESAFVRPGEIIQVMDANVAGKRRGGRVAAGTTASHIVFDAPIGAMTAGGSTYISCIVGEGVLQTRQCTVGASASNPTYADAFDPFSAAPKPDTLFVINEATDLETTLWRVISVRQADTDKYEINGVRHFPGKWNYVEKNIPLTEPDISDIPLSWPAVKSLAVKEYLVQTSPISVGVRVVLSWVSNAPSFEVAYKRTEGNWQRTRTDAKAIDLAVTEGEYTFRVVPISLLGVRGPASSIVYTVVGRLAPPLAPQQFRVKVSDGVALFQWLPATELDVIIGGHFELRYASRTSGATWAMSQTVISSIPGSATTVEALYRPGTWFLRTFDIVGTPSAQVATVIALQPDGRYNEFAQICENPDFLGQRNYTEVLLPQQWLVIGQTGGMWDAQLADMDSWPDVDVLVEGMPSPPQSEPRHGWYIFEDRIDAGGVFTVRFGFNILAFPYQEGSENIDDRLDNCDDWSDWDDVSADLNGQVQLYMRTTNDDPASPAAAWGDWQAFSLSEYTARGFEFRADLYAPMGQNIGIEELCITADLRMKMDSGEDIPAAASGVNKHVTFKTKFYLVPSVVVTVQEALPADKINIVNKTREGFDLNITYTSPPAGRSFDWQARGY